MKNYSKYIHFCWFGSAPLSPLAEKCIASWRKYLPDHEIMLWNEENSPMHLPYMQRALDNKNWANLSNITRLYALLQYGGWYFDTDIEVVKSPDFSEYKEGCFLGLESKPNETKYQVNNACIYSEPAHPFIQKCYDYLLQKYDGSESAYLSSPVLTTEMLATIGFAGNSGVYQDVRVLPYDYFYPSGWSENYHPSMRTNNTFAIHYNDASWVRYDAYSDDEIRHMLKKIDGYKKELRMYKSGQISISQLLKLNLKYFRGLFIK